ncbi:uncharacterized protein LOC117150095 isoform X2 [Drosophila mauritiana]|uniref:Uncharacterized protein LOC117150095 isoform X2 n=1 Tax=Drosophila mauritiana TaxID=7226 RepID=A0A6P8LDZ2_DROMA|nr:uncharacterized protein LOC117150095 isoform X2 [Drosophila mauritiana]
MLLYWHRSGGRETSWHHSRSSHQAWSSYVPVSLITTSYAVMPACIRRRPFGSVSPDAGIPISAGRKTSAAVQESGCEVPDKAADGAIIKRRLFRAQIHQFGMKTDHQ